jgi:integrase
MPVRKNKRGQFEVEVCYRRQRVHRVCPKDTSKAQAQQLEAQIRKDLFLARSGVSNNLISDALANYVKNHLAHSKSYKDSVSHVYRLADWVDGARLSSAPSVCERFKAEARGSYAPATINRSVAALRRSCHLAYRLGWVSDPVHLKISGLPENNARQIYLTKAEVAKLIDCTQDQQTKDAIQIAAYTGLRLGEIISLGRGNVIAGMIRLDANTKTGKPRSVPIVPQIRPALKRLPFTWPKRKIQEYFARARKKAGLEHVHIHDLRHHFASELINHGVDLYTVGALLGHSTPATTQRYAHLATASLKAAMRKIS